MKNKIKNFLNTLPYIKALYAKNEAYDTNSCFPPGHYYSPIVLVEELKKREHEIWKHKEIDGINDINLNTDEQKSFVSVLSGYYKDLLFKDTPSDALRYGYKNGMYEYTDGILLYAIIRYLVPKRIIEVGSGHSSALMLDVNELYFNNEIQLSFIEPNPERLYNNILENDKSRTTILEKKVQEIDTSFFSVLQKGDILFIDSTHVSKCGSDVNYILFEILPVLNSGVFIHFHDIFYPFEYPKDWVFGGRNWNENYLLKAFLMHNNDYKIRVFSHYLHTHHPAVFENMPLTYKNVGGNLWIEKLR